MNQETKMGNPTNIKELKYLENDILVLKNRCCVIATETNILKRLNDTDISKCKSPYRF